MMQFFVRPAAPVELVATELAREDVVRAWADVAGTDTSQHTRPVAFSEGTLTVQAGARYMSKIYTAFTPINAANDLTVRPKNTLFDANVGIESADGRWRFGLWGKNLTDKTVINNTFAVASLVALRTYQPPREIGIDIGFNF